LKCTQLTQSHAKISSLAEIEQNLTKPKSALLPKKNRHEFYRLAVIRPFIRACRQFDDLSNGKKGSTVG
jgi:hypothetical protein